MRRKLALHLLKTYRSSQRSSTPWGTIARKYLPCSQTTSSKFFVQRKAKGAASSFQNLIGTSQRSRFSGDGQTFFAIFQNRLFFPPLWHFYFFKTLPHCCCSWDLILRYSSSVCKVVFISSFNFLMPDCYHPVYPDCMTTYLWMPVISINPSWLAKVKSPGTFRLFFCFFFLSTSRFVRWKCSPVLLFCKSNAICISGFHTWQWKQALAGSLSAPGPSQCWT